MIVTTAERPAQLLGPGAEHVRIRCLARRGMLHSECEAVEHLRLGPHARYDLLGRAGTEAAWYVLHGTLTLDEPAPGGEDGTPPRPRALLGEQSLILAPHGEEVRLHAGPLGAELLCLTLTPDAVTRRLPPRVPDTTREHTP
ncbi:hypothetical protein ACZ90_68190 [Streptomyces albus subsp. albus]|nr:hypothetical protein ACZ90_68190 [Streptomyces albus subsp. albus]